MYACSSVCVCASGYMNNCTSGVMKREREHPFMDVPLKLRVSAALLSEPGNG